MENKELIKVKNEKWYQSLIDDCKSILVEGIFNYRWTLIETYHNLGKRILEDEPKMKQGGSDLRKTLTQVSNSLGKSERTIYRAVEFAQKYPDIQTLPEGKNISWHKICNNLLPALKEDKIILPKEKFSVLYFDPPWPYPEHQDAKNLYGAVSSHYQTMTIKEISEMDVNNLGADNSVLFLWATTNFLTEAFEIIKAWGFNYKSNMVWVKTSGSGIGYYVRGNHELLLIATKGSFLPKTKDYVSSVVKADRLEHSQKPEIFYEIIEKLYPDEKYYEMFARDNKKRLNWEYGGNQANK